MEVRIKAAGPQSGRRGAPIGADGGKRTDLIWLQRVQCDLGSPRETTRHTARILVVGEERLSAERYMAPRIVRPEERPIRVIAASPVLRIDRWSPRPFPYLRRAGLSYRREVDFSSLSQQVLQDILPLCRTVGANLEMLPRFPYLMNHRYHRSSESTSLKLRQAGRTTEKTNSFRRPEQ